MGIQILCIAGNQDIRGNMKIEDAFSINRIDELKTALIEIYKRRNTPPDNSYSKLLEYTNSVLENENQSRRPADSNGLPGGIVCLKPDITTIIVPDLHGRIKFLLNLLAFTDESGTSILQKLAFNQIQIVCVGDGFHSEYKTEERFFAFYSGEEFQRLVENCGFRILRFFTDRKKDTWLNIFAVKK